MSSALANGALSGGLIGLAAAGFTALWRLTGVLNLAQGALMVLGAYATWVVAAALDAPAGLLAALLIGALIGYVLQRGLLNLLLGHPGYLALAGTFSVGLALDSLATLLFANDYRVVPSAITSTVITIGPLHLLAAGLVAFCCATLGTGALAYLLSQTHFGLALRAASIDRDAGRLTGLPVPALFGVAAALSAAAATFAGGLLSLTGPFTATDGNQLLVLIAAAAMIGGAGRLWRAFAAGVVLGGIQATVGYLAPAALADAAAIVILLVALAPRALEARTASDGASGLGGLS